MVEFGADGGVAFAIDFVAGKSSTRGRSSLSSTINCCSSIAMSICRALISGARRWRVQGIPSDRDGAAWYCSCSGQLDAHARAILDSCTIPQSSFTRR